MNFGQPPKRRGPKKKKGKLSPEDVAEDNPQLAQFLRERRKAEARMTDAGDMDFYLVLVAQSEAQKNEFLDNLPEQVNVLYNMYVDLQSLAKACGIEGVTPNIHGPMQSPLNKRLTARTGIPDQGTDGTADTFWGFG
jgi:hypothetical protein